jgi:short-subunit dehydrogenase
METVVITGCSRGGIGYATACLLRDEGYRVYATARRQEELDALAKEGFDGVLYLDVTDAVSIRNVIEQVVSEAGGIDVWFNNAGYGQPGALEDIRTEVLREQFETNVFGLHECTRQVLRVMRERGRGKIIQHSSVLGLVSLFGRGSYNASKYAVEGLSDTLRLELHGSDIYVSVLNTGPVTSLFRKNAMRKLRENVDIRHSRFKEKYEASLQAKKSEVPFNLEADAVAKTVLRIIRSPKPKPRYYITKATYMLGFFKRVLPTAWLDKLMMRIS